MGSDPWRDTAHLNAVNREWPEYRDLFDAADAVRATLASPGWAHISRLVDAKTSEVEAALDARLLDSRAEYARMHGLRKGLRAAHEAAWAILSRADQRLKEQQAKHERDVDASLEGVR